MASAREKRAMVMFNTLLLLRKAGTFETNQEFRKNVLEAFEAQFFITRASASALYNTVKKTAQAQDPSIKLGKDPIAAKKQVATRRRTPAAKEERYLHIVGMRAR
jgi:hypothetical protein